MDYDRRSAKILAVARLGSDLVAITVAMLGGLFLSGIFPGRDPAGALTRHLQLGALSLPVCAAVFWRRRLYSEPHIAGRLDEFRRVVRAALTSLGFMVIAAFLLRLYVSRGWLLLSGLLAIILLAAEREFVRRSVGRLRRKGRLLRRVIVVGSNVEALSLCAMLAEEPALGYMPIGFLDDELAPGSQLLGGYPVLGAVKDTCQVAWSVRASAVIIATTAIDHESTNRLIRQLASTGLQVELSSSLRDIAPSRLMLRPLGRLPVVHVDRVNHDGWEMRAKRSFDILAAASVGVLAAPVLVAAAIAIKLSSRGPVLFRQQRVGKHGEPFEVLKLRTMVLHAEFMMDGLRHSNEADGPLFKLKGDPRITRAGRILRALSIDELPQLWNVFRGDMSLVGPRPALPKEVTLWPAELHGRLAVKPGMTGMWQVSGGRSTLR